MEDWQERVVEEARQVQHKICKLNIFKRSISFDLLKEEDQSLIFGQSVHMNNYLELMRDRIDRFKSPEDKSALDSEFKLEDSIDRGSEKKSIKSLTATLEKYSKDCSSDINYMICDFDTCLGITRHICNTRDIKDLEFEDVFKFIQIQMNIDRED